MPSNTHFDIIMPSFNGERHIRKSIESVISQSFPSWRLWIGDDNSTDSTVEVLEELQATDARISVSKFEENRGAPLLRNELVKRGVAPLLIFLDQDDVLEADSLNTRLGYFGRVSDGTVLSGGVTIIDSDDKLIKPWKPKNRNRLSPNSLADVSRRKVFWGHPIKLCSATIPRDSFERVSGFEDLRGGEEWVLWNRLVVDQSKIQIFNKPIVRYRVHNNNTSTSMKHARMHSWIESVLRSEFSLFPLSRQVLASYIYFKVVVRSIKYNQIESLIKFSEMSLTKTGNRAPKFYKYFYNVVLLRLCRVTAATIKMIT